MTLLLDLLTCAWIAVAAASIYLGLPLTVRRFCRAGGPPVIPLMAGLLLWTVTGMTALGALSLVNPATVLGLHVTYALSVFAASHRCFDHGAERLLRAVAAVRAGFPAARTVWQQLLARLPSRIAAAAPLSDAPSRPHLVALAALTAVASATRLWPALLEARLFDPAGYDELALVRRVVEGPWPGVTLGAPAWSAALAMLTALDPAYIARFLPALLACVLTCVLPRIVLRISGRFDAAVVAVACWLLAGSGIAVETPWGSILSRQHVAIGPYAAALLLLALLADNDRENRLTRQRVLAALAVIVFSPPLGVVAVMALASSAGIRRGVIAAAWMTIAVAGLHANAHLALLDAAVTLPLAMAVSAAMACAALPRRIYLPERSSAVACGALVAVGGFTVLPPSHPMEHDGMARQTLRIVRHSTEGEWTIVARDVPLLKGHRGQHVMPMRVFVACSSGALLPECAAAQRTTTYVIVQKRPFDVSALADEQTVLFAVERLVHAIKGSHIDYEDGILRVYVIPPQQWALR